MVYAAIRNSVAHFVVVAGVVAWRQGGFRLVSRVVTQKPPGSHVTLALQRSSHSCVKLTMEVVYS